MKKKGFTLVELLAVIAILAILVIIALPNVLEMFNNAKKNTFVTEVESIYKQAQTDFIQKSLEEAGPRTFCAGGSGVTEVTAPTCTDGALQLTTTKSYLISMDSSGAVLYIGVADNSYVYGAKNVNSINDIDKNKVKDASEINNFELKAGDPTSGKANVTN